MKYAKRVLMPDERIPVSIARFVRQTYAVPERKISHYRTRWHLLNEPLITEIFAIPDHKHFWDKWTPAENVGNPESCIQCWGQTHIVKLTYAVEGYGADIGGHYDDLTDKWVWVVWND